MCLLVSFAFWVFLTLDEVIERDYQVEIRIDNVPDSVVVLGNIPTSVNAVLKGKGAQFVKFNFGGNPQMKFDFVEVARNNSISVSRSHIDARLRDIFGQSINIMSVSPDSVSVSYTADSGVRLPLVVRSQITTDLQSVMSGIVTADVDSVSVYSVSDIPSGLKHVETELLTIDNVADTVRCKVKVKQIAGMRIKPEVVTVTVPVEMLISKTRKLPIETVNMPVGKHLIALPSTVEIRCLMPMRYHNADFDVKAIVDFDRLTPGGKAKVFTSKLPSGFQLISVKPDSVDYYISDLDK